MRAIDPTADIVTQIMGEVDGLIPMSENEARDIALALTGANGAGLVPFWHRGGDFSSHGDAGCDLWVGSIEQAHKPDEFIAMAIGQGFGFSARIGPKAACRAMTGLWRAAPFVF